MPLLVRAEGSKQLTPNSNNLALTDPNNTRAGFLSHDANFASNTGVGPTSLSFLKSPGFNYNGATYSEDHRLYVKVKPGERLHFGVHRTTHDQGTGNQGNLNITVKYRDANGTIVTVNTYTLTANTSSTRAMLLVDGQAGVISTAAQATAGPNRSGVTNGYPSISIASPSTAGIRDYFFEFNQVGESNMSDGQRFSVYDFWDFTVVDANNVEKPGRLYSKLWSFSAGGTSNVFSKYFDMFPLIPSETQSGRFYVKKLELAGIAPQNFFRFVTNKFGSNTSVGTSFAERRKSQTSNTDYPEYNNFVNNPDPELWPSAIAPTFSMNIGSYCSSSTTNSGAVTFNGNSSEASTMLVLVDLNGTAGYQPGTADVLLEQSGPSGARIIEWNGLNGFGQKVPSGTTINYRFKNGSAPVNFPMWDAETNLDGFRVGDVRPLQPGQTTFSYNSELYWDDSKLSTSRFPAPQTQLFGIGTTTDPSATSGGEHRWGAASATAGDLYTVNTWTYGYTNSINQSVVYSYDCSVDLAVTNTAASAPYIIGKPFTYTVTLTNNGPQTATGVSLTDLLDATKLTLVSATPSAGTYNASTGVWTVGDISMGGSRTLTITATPKVLGTISTEAKVTAVQQTDSNVNNNAQTATITVVAAADIEVKNTVPATTYNNGDLVTYTITAKNLGPNAATGVSVTDQLPAGLTFVSASSAAYSASTGVWSVGDLALNETKTLTITARASALGTITTTASLGSRAGHQVDDNSSNNTSSNTITVAASADVRVTNEVSTATPNQNDVITYTIKAFNDGPNNATNVSLSSVLPAGLEIISGSPTMGTFELATGKWTVGTVVNGTNQTLTITARPKNTGSISLTYTQTHTEFDRISTNNSATSTVTVSPTADVAVTNTVSAPVGGSYKNGDLVTYTVVVKNNGPSTATNVIVTDKLPASLTFNSYTATNGSAVYDASTGYWTVGSLANGASATLTLNATINRSDVITTTASQTHAEYDNVSGNNRASNSITSGTGQITADIAIDVTKIEGTYYTGQPVTFKVRVDNLGPDLATNLSLNALLPATMQYVSSDLTIGTYDAASGIWTVGSLSSGAFTELILVATPKPAATASATEQVNHTFSSSLRTLAESQGTNAGVDTDSETIHVNKLADIATSMSVTSNSPDGKYYNGVTTATFTFTVTNNGPDKATGVAGIDSRSNMVRFIGFTPGMGYDPYTGEWNVGELEPGASKTVIVNAIPTATGRVNLGGHKTAGDQYDPTVENDKSVALLNVLPSADLEVKHTVAAGPYYKGQPTTFTVTLTNLGPDAATNVMIEDIIPAGLTFVSSTATLGTYNSATGIWSLGSDVLPNQPQTLSITVIPTTDATINMLAKVTMEKEYDHVASNNSASASITAEKSADIEMSTVVASGNKYVDQPFTITIKARNLGPDAATGVAIIEQLPAGLMYVSATTSIGSFDPVSGSWSIAELANGVTALLELTVVPNRTGSMTNYAYKSFSSEYDPNGQNNQTGNNRTSSVILVQDRPATFTINAAKNFYDYQKGDILAFSTDADGEITFARIISGSIPAGTMLQPSGVQVVTDNFSLRPGVYTATIETTDKYNGITTQSVTITITGDRDGDGVNDFDDIDDNNDGITDKDASGGVDPYGDENGDGLLNYYDPSYVYPGGKAFVDVNGDGINDWFDTDLDGIINSLDSDFDGDGITNAIEANAGVAPVEYGYNATKGILTGSVSANGMPVLVQTSANSGISKYPVPDSDKDGLKDMFDIDSDNDGLPDVMEAQTTAGYRTRSNIDIDRDGLDDAFDPDAGGISSAVVDTDKDGFADYIDIDSDNDSKTDTEESFDDNEDGKSFDDLILRASYFTDNKYPTLDTNKNGLPDWMEDDNKNGILNFMEPGNAYYFDSNNDGLVDLFDARTSGTPVRYQLNANKEMNYRDGFVLAPLPVTLIKFTAKAQKDGVILNWATASEVNNERFVIERSEDAKSFTMVGSIKGALNSHSTVYYSMVDANAPLGTVYYRLKQVDTDGTFKYSTVVAVEVVNGINSKAVAILYPNPTSGLAKLNMSSLPTGMYTISIISMDGRVVKQLQLNTEVEQQLDFSNLTNGKYVLRLQGQRLQQTISFIKN
ncbi:hypothetical protein GCM10028895_07720 [Pontibacter rugosus]